MTRNEAVRIVAVFLTSVLAVAFPAAWGEPGGDRISPPAVDAIPLPIDRGAIALWQSLRKLETRASLVMIVAHPDDEDGGMLTYESRGLGTRVALLTLNRGEGGQNVMSDDYWDRLGQVRTQELLAADRYYGVQQFFTRVVDYGFSKTKEEALEKWGHDRVLYDVVRVIRMTRPLVVTSVSVGGPTDGHGHHQIAGLMAQEVFEAAGDPHVFPDQIEAGLLPWKPLKVYARVPFFAPSKEGMYDYATDKYVPVRFYDYAHKQWIEGPLSTDLSIPSGTYDPVLGQSYVQIARTGLGLQKSQTGGSGPALPGAVKTPYHRFASSVPTAQKETSFFDGMDMSLLGIADLAHGEENEFLKRGLTDIHGDVQEAIAKFDIEHPEHSATALARGLGSTRALIKQVQQSSLSATAKYNVNYELQVKEQQFNDAIVQALGLSLLATVAPEKEPQGRFAAFLGTPETFQVAIPGQEFWAKVTATSQSTVPVVVQSVNLKTSAGEQWTVEAFGAAPSALADNIPASERFKVRVPQNAKLTRPYFSRPDIEQAWNEIQDPRDLNLPVSPYPLFAELDAAFAGESIRMAQVVQTVRRATGPGIEFQPLILGPALSVSISPKAGIIPVSGSKFAITVRVESNVKGEAKGTLKLDVPPGWIATPAEASFVIAREGEEQHVNFEVSPGKLRPEPYQVTAVAEFQGQKFTQGYDMAGYQGLRRYPLYAPATLHTRGVDVQVAKGLRVGYVTGTGDDVPESLRDIGVNVQFLSSQDLATSDLGRYDSIVLGVRAYAARPDLVTHNSRLLEYVRQGGILFVQYNSGEYDHNYGPFAYTLTNTPEKVVDETAKVTILEPKNPLMSWPNKITSADFDGWVEERGHCFMKRWDPQYIALTEVHDPEQDPQKGGLLYARYGKGAYIYAAYALYRQLPEGVPGAFRLFANVLSLARSPALAAQGAGLGPHREKPATANYSSR